MQSARPFNHIPAAPRLILIPRIPTHARQPVRRERGEGSGVIVNPEGYILTNDHVVRQASDIRVTLGELPESQQRATLSGSGVEMMDGVQAQDLTPELARQLSLPPDAFGVVISSVKPGTPAAEAGLRRGDAVQEVNRSRVATWQPSVRSSPRPAAAPLSCW